MAQPRGRGFGRNVVISASRGAVLIGLAVVIGLVLLQVVDDAGGGGGGGASGGGPTGTTATTGTDGSTTTTVASGDTGRPASEVVVQVLNGSGVQGAANQRSNDLKAKGYQVLPAGNAPAQRTGTAVECRKGFEKEANGLVAVLGTLSIQAKVETFPATAPTGVPDTANCIVILGK